MSKEAQEKSLILGFGGTGTHILTYLKELAVYKFGRKPDFLHFLEFDTIANWKPGETISIAGGAGAEETIASGIESRLDPDTEYFHLKDHPPGLRELAEHRMGLPADRQRYPHLDPWLNTEQLKRLMPPAAFNITRGAAQQRQIGRYSMFINVSLIQNQLTRILRELSRAAGRNTVNVWLVGSAAGGTGAGCMLDAAFMVLMAARTLNIQLTMTGVIVLPEVYGDKSGISKARAYSMFRELERLQSFGLQPSDRYTRQGQSISAEVRYSASGDNTALMPNRLFDYLVFLGQPCGSEPERKAFFNSVASAIDPYIDENVGAGMMEKLVNKTSGKIIGFGAARLSAPLATYAERFAWELARDYLASLAAPHIVERQVTGVAFGSERDRSDSAKQRVIGLLALFKELDALLSNRPDDLNLLVNTKMQPREIINGWYQFSAPEAAGLVIKDDALARDVPLTYVNPFLSLDTWEDRVDPKDFRVKTYQENSDTKGAKESPDQSLVRFQADLRDVVNAYTDANGGEGSLRKGRTVVLDVVSRAVLDRVDKAIISALTDSSFPGILASAKDQGTPISRLYKELQISVSMDGPLQTLEVTLSKMVEGLEAKASDQRQMVADAQRALSEVVKSTFFFGKKVTASQEEARAACGAYILWFQRRYLIEDMRDLVARVRGRFQRWLDTVTGALVGVALTRQADRSALIQAQVEIDRLDDRLARLASDSSTFISLASLARDGSREDTGMQGFVEKRLKPLATQQEGRSLIDIALEGSKWEPSIGRDGQPNLALRWPGGRAEGTPLRTLHRTLYEHFSPKIDQAMKDFDIFSYLVYAEQEHRLGPKELASLLYSAARLNLGTEGGTMGGSTQWVFRQPRGSEDKRNYADRLKGELNSLADSGVQDNVANHSDGTSITILRATEAAMDQIEDIRNCSRAYREIITESSGAGQPAEELPHALVYHAFRAEAEAWQIERHHYLYIARTKPDSNDGLIPPRIARLLENPPMAQAFVHAVAVGALQRPDPDEPWLWHHPTRPTPVVMGPGDLLAVAVQFILQQRAGSDRGLDTIELPQVKESLVLAAKKKEQTLTAALRSFLAGQPDLVAFLRPLLDEPRETLHNPEKRKEWDRTVNGLSMVFRYYLTETGEPTLAGRTL
jgi:hypothetical protein